MIYRQLLAQLQTLTEEQLDCEVRQQALVICENDGPPLRVILLLAPLDSNDLAQVRDLAEYYCQEVHDIAVDEAAFADEVENILRDMNPEDELRDMNPDEDEDDEYELFPSRPQDEEDEDE